MFLEKNVFRCYTELNFPRGKSFRPLNQRLSHKAATAVQAISRFANVTLSSLYFDITKDILYANVPHSPERRAVVSIFEKVCYFGFLSVSHMAEFSFTGIGQADVDACSFDAAFSGRDLLL